MLEEVDSLAAKLTELSAHVRALRDENQQLRNRLANANAELDGLRERVGTALARIDALIERLPADAQEEKAQG
jgi:uncharacterized coiled-coil DUF342 family protein